MTDDPSRISQKVGSERSVLTFEYGASGTRVVITAGLHGWETSAIALAWELSDRLAALEAAGSLRARVTVLPVCNPMGTLAMSRLEPESGADLNRIFPADGRMPVHPTLSAVARQIAQAEVYIDLHSAGAASYVPHVLVAHREHLDEARYFGLRFAILRGTSDHDLGTSLHFAHAHGARAFCLEAGGGTSVEPGMVRAGMSAIGRFLAHHGLIHDVPAHGGHATALYARDVRRILKTRNGGIFYAVIPLGCKVQPEEVIGYRINSDSWQREAIAAGALGDIIYLRSESRVCSGDTLAMILPPHGELDGGAELKTVLV